ncbi:UNVERIFIED_CONTAM: hypothetical protein PYX00_004014 [Menopon gallinae]|uniref:Kinesin motor domain-containing protein n=1 Tax=Menopon gallinae TaxID=328185 RepID=A0AAW2I2Z3_9NEOP
MSEAKLSYLVPRDPSIKCWEDRVKLQGPLTTNMVKHDIDALEESVNEKLKVYLRIKPYEDDVHPYTVFSNTLEVEAPKDKKLTKDVGKLVHKFHFSHIFNQHSTQESIFENCVLHSLKGFVHGQNDLLFAHGTTNAGKTYTMQGTMESPGVIPRSIQFLFSCLKNNIETVCHYQPRRCNDLYVLTSEEVTREIMHKNFILNLDLAKYQRCPEMSYRSYRTDVTCSSTFSDVYRNETYSEMESNISEVNYEVGHGRHALWISMIEIHNEQIYDLLEVPDKKGARVKLGIAEDGKGKVYIKNQRYVNVISGHEALQVYQFGRANLRLGPTALNNESSRSHCIFTLTLAKFLDGGKSDRAILSRFSFCDLAGSERVKKALTDGLRLAESKSINTSLSIFAKCLNIIRDNQANGERKIVPYRESKLTRLFRDAMMGKQSFSIIVNITPEPHLFNETLYVLKFSAIAQQIIPVKAFPKQKKPALRRSKFASVVANATDCTDIEWDSPDIRGVREDKRDSAVFEQLTNLIDSLKEELAQERRRADTIESEIRQSLSDQFTRMFSEFNEKNKNIHDREIKHLQEMHDRKQKRLIEYYENQNRMKRKRMKDESFDDIEMEGKMEQMEKDLKLLQSENDSLRQMIQQLNSENRKLQRKRTQLEFDLSEKSRLLKATVKSRETNGSGDFELVKELENQVQQSESKITGLKNLLGESAFEYKDLLQTNECLVEENENLERELAKTTNKVEDLKNELLEYHKICSAKTVKIEELEEKLEKFSEYDFDSMSKENEALRLKCADQDEEIKALQREVKNLTRQNIDQVKKVVSSEGEAEYKELLSKNAELEKCIHELKNKQEEEKRVHNSEMEDVRKKLETAENEYNLLKTRDEEEKASINSEIVKLKEENQLLTNELKNMQNEIDTFQENREKIFSQQEREIQELREENERLKKEKSTTVPETPEKTDEKDSEGDSSPVENGTEGNGEIATHTAEETLPVEDTPDRLSRRLENLMVFHSETKKSCKKVVGGVEESLHPSLMKSKRKGKKAMEQDRSKVNDENELTKKGNNKCTRKLFTGNDFDCVSDLESSFVEPEIPRLRPRRK